MLVLPRDFPELERIEVRAFEKLQKAVLSAAQALRRPPVRHRLAA